MGVAVCVDVGVGVGVGAAPAVEKLKGADLYSAPPTKAPTTNVYAVAGWRFRIVSLAPVSSSPATATPLM
ncbi:hypothetical protein CXX84_03435 [Arthrobacter sp. AFG7.2]|nr:hypothetical protein CXX84_03435 [Arthrobacter sp. AFG7.2]